MVLVFGETMNERQDILAGEVSVAAKVDQTGLSVAAKSRFVSALDRLCGNAVQVLGGGWLESRAARQKARTDAEEAIRNAMIGAIAKSAEAGEFGQTERIFNRLLGISSRKQGNIDEIAYISFDELKNVDDDSIKAPDDAGTLDEDWLNFFEMHASNASSEQLQLIWAKILAGQVRNPSAFSPTTLRIMSEIDKDLASNFERILTLASSTGAIIKEEAQSILNISELMLLQEHGLISEAAGFLTLTMKKNEQGWVIVIDGDYLLRCISSSDELTVPVMILTRSGRELMNILPRQEHKRFLLAVYERIKDQITDCDISRITSRNVNGTVSFDRIELLKGTIEALEDRGKVM